MIRLATFSLAIFMAAFLSFAVEPLAGHHALHMAGGTPQSWLVVLAFFQCALLAGYVFVFLTQRLDARLTAIVPCALLVLAWFQGVTLPVMQGDGPVALYILLWQWLGLPMTAMGMVAPLLQRLFAAGSANPYRLYALSNAGAFAGLLAYPAVIEPFFGLSLQNGAWRWMLIPLACVIAACAMQAGKSQKSPHMTAPSLKTFGFWMLLAALPASLLSSTTLVLTSAIASFPLLWIVPLALYLLTFIIAFDDRSFALVKKTGTPLLVVGFMLLTMGFNPMVRGILTSIPLLPFLLIISGFILAAFLCHQRLYALRPDASTLPVFYLAIALGGVIGGGFNAFIAPHLLRDVSEFYIGISLLIAFVGIPSFDKRGQRNLGLLSGLAVILLCATILYAPLPAIVNAMLASFIIVIFALTFVDLRIMALTSTLCLLLASLPGAHFPDVIYQHRNYFGITRVMESDDDKQYVLTHGSTIHGNQPLDPAWRKVPVSYYGIKGPAGTALALYPRGKVAVVGLGTGQMACYGTSRRQIDFYEIDPDMVDVALNWFQYLEACPPNKMVIGDARRTLAASSGMYDVIVLDAFSSDDVPTHLLTLEALETYLAHLKPGGMVAFHISNRFFDLWRPLSANAASMQLSAFRAKDKDFDQATRPYDSNSEWLVMTANKGVAAKLDKVMWTPVTADGPWRDDFAPLLSALRILQ